MSDFEKSTIRILNRAIEELKLSIGDALCDLFEPIVRWIADFLEYVTSEEPTEKKKREFISKQDAEIIERLRTVEYHHPVQMDELLKLAELAGLLSHEGYRYSDIEACILNMVNGTKNTLLSAEETLDLINDLKELYE